jgi:hypothetical protein
MNNFPKGFEPSFNKPRFSAAQFTKDAVLFVGISIMVAGILGVCAIGLFGGAL